MNRQTFLSVLALIAASAGPAVGTASAHSVHYEVRPGGVAVRAFHSPADPAARARYQIHGPGDQEPHQEGNTDRNGFVAFVPDRPGTWKIRIWGDSGHGFHGVSTDVEIDQAMKLESFSKPLVAAHTKLVTGVSLAFGLFGLYALWTSRKRAKRSDPREDA